MNVQRVDKRSRLKKNNQIQLAPDEVGDGNWQLAFL